MYTIQHNMRCGYIDDYYMNGAAMCSAAVQKGQHTIRIERDRAYVELSSMFFYN